MSVELCTFCLQTGDYPWCPSGEFSIPNNCPNGREESNLTKMPKLVLEIEHIFGSRKISAPALASFTQLHHAIHIAFGNSKDKDPPENFKFSIIPIESRSANAENGVDLDLATWICVADKKTAEALKPLHTGTNTTRRLWIDFRDARKRDADGDFRTLCSGSLSGISIRSSETR